MVGNSKQAFMQAIQELLVTTPFDHITVSELSRVTGYSRKSFYKNFIDVYDLIQQVFRDDLTTTARNCGFKDYESFIDVLSPVLQDSDNGGLYDRYLTNLEEMFYDKRFFYAKAFTVEGPNSLRSYFCGISSVQCHKYTQYTAEKLNVSLSDKEVNEIAEYHATAITEMMVKALQSLAKDSNADKKILRGKAARRSYKFVYSYIWYLANNTEK